MIRINRRAWSRKEREAIITRRSIRNKSVDWDRKRTVRTQ